MNFLNERKLPLDVPLDTLLFSETRIACVDATGFLSDVYNKVHERNQHLLTETRIMRLIRINFFAPCTMKYTSTKS